MVWVGAQWASTCNDGNLFGPKGRPQIEALARVKNQQAEGNSENNPLVPEFSPRYHQCVMLGLKQFTVRAVWIHFRHRVFTFVLWQIIWVCLEISWNDIYLKHTIDVPNSHWLVDEKRGTLLKHTGFPSFSDIFDGPLFRRQQARKASDVGWGGMNGMQIHKECHWAAYACLSMFGFVWYMYIYIYIYTHTLCIWHTCR